MRRYTTLCNIVRIRLSESYKIILVAYIPKLTIFYNAARIHLCASIFSDY